MKHGIMEAGDIPAGDKVYLKKDKLGYRIVYPIKNEDGSINWMNFLFGGKGGLIKLCYIAVFFALLFFGFNQVTSECAALAEDPCYYCKAGIGDLIADRSYNDLDNIDFSGLVSPDGSEAG